VPPTSHGSKSLDELLGAARRGDEAAFARLTEPYRRELHAHCYRILGSLHDTEEALQETMLRVWRGLDRFEGRSSLRAWLYKIATNTCLDSIARRKRRLLPEEYAPKADPTLPPGDPVAEGAWIEPYPDEALEIPDGYASPDARYEEREALELAFVAAMQHLSPRQRAALILREVLGFSAKEVGETLETSVPSVNSALQRARETIDRRLPDRSQQLTLRSLGNARMKEIVEEYMEAMGKGDVQRVVSMLTEDVAWSMPPLASWYGGIDEVEVFLRTKPLSGEWQWRHRAATANGQLAVGTYTWIVGEETHVPFSLDVITLEGDRIKEVTAFVVRPADTADGYARWPERAADPRRVESVFRRFGLPDHVD
jgi:RNA polymerase sigma-70 factor (ECF subfamily)